MRSARKRMLASNRAEVGSSFVARTLDALDAWSGRASVRSAMSMNEESGLLTVYHSRGGAQRKAHAPQVCEVWRRRKLRLHLILSSLSIRTLPQTDPSQQIIAALKADAGQATVSQEPAAPALPLDGEDNGLLARFDLEVGVKPQAKAARRTNGVAGEKAAEVDHVQNIVKVLSVGLNIHLHAIRLVNLRPGRGVDLERWINAASSEVDPIQHLLSVLRQHRCRVAYEFKGQAGVKLNSSTNPETRPDLVASAPANGVPLIGSNRKVSVDLCFRGGGVVPEK